MSSRLASIISRFDISNLPNIAGAKVGMLIAVRDQMLEVAGFPYPLGTAVKISTKCGGFIGGEVVGFRGSSAIVQPLDMVGNIAEGAAVYAQGRTDAVAVGDALLGRILDATGQPLDGKPKPHCGERVALSGKSRNPLHRGRVTRPVDCGIRAINGLLTIGEGQRVALIAGSGVGKSVLMGQLLQGINADVIVVGLIGERAREVTDFVEGKLDADTRSKSVIVATAADQVPLLRLRAAMRASAIAEYFSAKGKKVLLLIDSLTRIAHAQREIGLALGEPPTMKGYTPSSLSLIPQLVERAGVDTKSGGSITAIYTVLADGGDLEDPVVDAARAIVDGHIVLSRNLAENGIFPAIDVGKSLSRLMPDIVDDRQLAAAMQFRQMWSSYEQNRDLVMMGAYAAGNDPVLDDAIGRHSEMLDFVRQPMDGFCGLGEASALLVEGFGR